MQKCVVVLFFVVGLVIGSAHGSSADLIKYFIMPDGSTLEVQVPPGKTVTQKEAEESWAAMNGKGTGEVRQERNRSEIKSGSTGLTKDEAVELIRHRVEQEEKMRAVERVLRSNRSAVTIQ